MRDGPSAVRVRPQLILLAVSLALAGCRPSPSLAPPAEPGVARRQPPAELPAELPVAMLLKQVDAARMRSDLEHLTVTIGPRESGTAGERAALDFVAQRWETIGLPVVWERDIPLTPRALVTANVGTKIGGRQRGKRVELGAHIDTIRRPGGVPGANDNGSGVVVLLEVARILAAQTPPRPVNLWIFGGEESVDGTFAHHHYGSRHHLAQLRAAGDLGIRAMLSVDMIGRGDQHLLDPLTRTPGDLALLAELTASGQQLGLPLRRGPVGREWSDHEAYAKAGIPAVWLHAEPDPNYHTRRDTAERVEDDHLVAYARLVLRYLFTPAG